MEQTNKTNKKSFEESVARLEEIVKELEGKEIPLDKSLKLYEEGVSLVGVCSSYLENAEKKIKVLSLGPTGIEEKDFKVGNDE